MQSGPCPKTRFDKTFFPKIAPFSCSQVQNYILQALVERGWERWCGILAARARPCAARTRLFGFIATPNGALRTPRPSQLRWSFRQYFWGQIMFFYILTVCCITDMHINDIHISVILRGFSRGPSLFWSIWGQNYVNIMSPAPPIAA
jgi:hypothetical protein